MSTAEMATYSAEGLLKMPEGDRYELVAGHLLEREEMGARAGWTAGRIHTKLDLYSEDGKRGWAFPAEVGIQCFPDDPEKVRRPDTFFVCRGRFENEEVPEGFVRLPPDVVAEVVSPTDLYYRVDGKVQEYLEAGVRLVWVINPQTRTVAIYRAGGKHPSRLGEQDELTGEEVLPGFCCQVAELFPTQAK